MSKNSEIYIRVDMNEVIATGHIMRCLSVADEAKDMGSKVVFITADNSAEDLLKDRGYKVIVLNSKWDDMEQELDILIPALIENRVKKLLVDSYKVTEKYLKKLEQYVDIYYIDDIDAFEYPVSNIICYANYYSKLSYFIYKSNPKLYLGTEYIPVRKAFQNQNYKRIKNKIENIVLLSGGGDPYHIAEKVGEVFVKNTQVSINIIYGAYYDNFETTVKKFKNNSKVMIYKNVRNIEYFMKEADLAISAGGTTLYELCAVGTPTISYSFVDNQKLNVLQFEEDGIISYAGDIRQDDIFKNIFSLYKIYEDINFRLERSKKMQKLVDGKGAERIARLLT